MSVCKLTKDAKEQFAKFRKANLPSGALVMTCDKEKMTIDVEEYIEKTSLESLASDLPVSAPRYILYSYKWKRSDGRQQFPLVFIYYSPNCNPTLNMLYSSSRPLLQEELALQTIMDLHDAEDLTEGWLIEQLNAMNRA